MLTNLYIENFTIIDKLDLDCRAGLTVITGETGAGKSILLDALEIVLGSRAESHLVRPGAERSDIIATFDIRNNTAVKSWLETQDLNTDECLLRRHISSEGRSRHFINGQPVPLQSLRTLSSLLINIHGQHEHQALLQKEAQRDLLDNYAQHHVLTEKIAKIYQEWRHIQKTIEEQQQQLGDRETRLSFLSFQVQEFDQLNISAEEITQLDHEQKMLANAEQRMNTYQQILALLEAEGQDSILQQLYHAQHLSQTLPASSLTELLDAASIQIKEAIDEIQRQYEKLEINPERLQTVEQRLVKLHDLARKHRVKLEELPELQQRLLDELKSLQHIDTALDSLKEKRDQLVIEYQETTRKLTQSRVKAAKKMAAAITQHMQTLGMPGGKLDIAIEPHAENIFTAHGAEKIEFQVSANPGQPLQPLVKVASGGELSRISLAIQVIAAENHPLPTLIFDEVDVGIGGSTAAIVGKLLQQLASNTQIICITHLPQVAAQGQTHWQVQKSVVKNQTVTQVKILSAEEKIQEIARMLGGLTITKQTLAHARELVEVT